MEALTKWQEKKPSVDLDGNNPHFKSKYATLANIIKTIQPILAECGLTYVQTVNGGNISTILMHPESDGLLVSERPIPDFNKVQDEGSFITYQKRYQLSALLGIATESDTDGEGVDKGGSTAKPRATETQMTYAMNNPEKGMPAGNRQVLDTMLTKYTLSSADVRSLVEAEYIHFPDRMEHLIGLLEGHGYELVKK